MQNLSVVHSGGVGVGHRWEALGLQGTQLVNIHSNLKEVGVTKHWTLGHRVCFSALSLPL